MKPVQAETNLPHYLAAGQGWETDQISSVKRSERRAWTVAIIAAAVALLAVIAVVLLTPLKTVEPFVVRVDKLGESDVVTLLDQRTVSASEALDKYWLSSYVNFREEYSEAMAYGNYRATELMSSTQVGADYLNQVRPERPQSPTAVYGTEGRVEVEVTNVSFIGNQHAQVRYTRTVKSGQDAQPSVSDWIATVTYDYVNPPMDEEARLINPVGFQVTDYRIDPDAVEGG